MFEVIVIILLLVILAAVPGGMQVLGGLFSSLWAILGLILMIGALIWFLQSFHWAVSLAVIAALFGMALGPSLGVAYRKKYLDEATDELAMGHRMRMLEVANEVEPQIYHHALGYYLVYVPDSTVNVRAFKSIEGARKIANKIGKVFNKGESGQSDISSL